MYSQEGEGGQPSLAATVLLAHRVLAVVELGANDPSVAVRGEVVSTTHANNDIVPT